MAHYAVLDSTLTVVRVFVGRDENDLAEGVEDWETYYAPERFTVKRTSYNTLGGEHLTGGTPFRYNYAGKGYTFDPNIGPDGAFIPPQPFPSWTLSEQTCLWEPPIPMPEPERDENGFALTSFDWDEAVGDWVEVVEPSA